MLRLGRLAPHALPVALLALGVLARLLSGLLHRGGHQQRHRVLVTAALRRMPPPMPPPVPRPAPRLAPVRPRRRYRGAAIAVLSLLLAGHLHACFPPLHARQLHTTRATQATQPTQATQARLGLGLGLGRAVWPQPEVRSAVWP